MKIDITKIDPNFKSPDADFENMKTYNAMSAPFEIKGRKTIYRFTPTNGSLKAR